MSIHSIQWSFSDGTAIPIGTMYCIGRNYAAHAREMGAEVADDPIVFLKPLQPIATMEVLLNYLVGQMTCTKKLNWLL